MNARQALPAALIAALTTAALGGCFGGKANRGGQDGPPKRAEINPLSVPDAVPRQEPRAKYGNMASYEVNGKRYTTLQSSAGFSQRGIASWYGRKFHGRRTSSGEPFDMYAMTAAHTQLPLPTYVRVRHLGNGRQVVVKVNDRGPFHGNRILDLSWAAAVKLGMEQQGAAMVEITAIDPLAGQTVAQRAPQQGALPPLSPAPAPRQPVQSAPPRQDIVAQYLQFGAFGEIANADALAGRLRSDGVPGVMIRQASTQLGTLFRVVSGPFINSTDLAAARSAMQQRGIAHTLTPATTTQ